MSNALNASREFAEAFKAYKNRRGELLIGIADAYHNLAAAGVPEAYSIEFLRGYIHPENIIRYWRDEVSFTFMEAYIAGRAAHSLWTDGNASREEITLVSNVLRAHGVPIDYAVPLIALGLGPHHVIQYWNDGVAIEYALELAQTFKTE
jgi:hypothetical protein